MANLLTETMFVSCVQIRVPSFSACSSFAEHPTNTWALRDCRPSTSAAITSRACHSLPSPIGYSSLRWLKCRGSRVGIKALSPARPAEDLCKSCATAVQANWKQIQFLLGHASVQMREHHLGCKRNLGNPINKSFYVEVIAAACVITVSAMIEKPDRIVYQHGVSSDQEGADTGTSARNAGHGHSPV